MENTKNITYNSNQVQIKSYTNVSILILIIVFGLNIVLGFISFNLFNIVRQVLIFIGLTIVYGLKKNETKNLSKGITFLKVGLIISLIVGATSILLFIFITFYKLLIELIPNFPYTFLKDIYNLLFRLYNIDFVGSLARFTCGFLGLFVLREFKKNTTNNTNNNKSLLFLGIFASIVVLIMMIILIVCSINFKESLALIEYIAMRFIYNSYGFSFEITEDMISMINQLIPNIVNSFKITLFYNYLSLATTIIISIASFVTFASLKRNVSNDWH